MNTSNTKLQNKINIKKGARPIKILKKAEPYRYSDEAINEQSLFLKELILLMNVRLYKDKASFISIKLEEDYYYSFENEYKVIYSIDEFKLYDIKSLILMEGKYNHLLNEYDYNMIKQYTLNITEKYILDMLYILDNFEGKSKNILLLNEIEKMNTDILNFIYSLLVPRINKKNIGLGLLDIEYKLNHLNILEYHTKNGIINNEVKDIYLHLMFILKPYNHYFSYHEKYYIQVSKMDMLVMLDTIEEELIKHL